MAALQGTIPFKSRKRTYMKESKVKARNNENEDILNTNIPNSILKRQVKETKDDVIFDDDICTSKKIARNIDQCSESNSLAKCIKPLVSREEEISWMEKYLLEHLEKEQSASLYISGQPGTGKTASLTYILQLPKIKEGFKQLYINCTMMKSAASIYSRICKELQIRTTGISEKACLSAIEKYLVTRHKMIYWTWLCKLEPTHILVISLWWKLDFFRLLVLDEIDQLDSKRQAVLYTIFEWAALPSRLLLVGVANALDLTQRVLPRLQARCSLAPATLHFAPYTKQQIIDIFTSVLAAEDSTNVFSPVALQMLAAKIAAISGDMRRALDIGRRVIEFARRSKFSEHKSIDNLMKDSTVTVELKQVLEVLNDVYGGCKKIETDVEEGLPMQQKLILCSLMLMLTKGKNKEIMMGKLYDVYKRVAVARNIAPLDASEMISACCLLESLGAMRVGGGGAGGARGRRLRLLWDQTELSAALRDKPLMSAILADTACLAS